MGSLRAVLVSLGVATWLVACGGDGSGGGGDASPVSTTATPGAGTVEPSGGTVSSADGVSVTVPASALATPTTIRIARDAAGAPPLALEGAGDIYALTPHGTTFAQPVEVRLPIPASMRNEPVEALNVAKAEAGGEGWTILDDVRREGDTLVARVTSFSFFSTIVIQPAPTPLRANVTITACAPGTLPSPGVCQTDTLARISARVELAGDQYPGCPQSGVVKATLYAGPLDGTGFLGGLGPRKVAVASRTLASTTALDGSLRYVPVTFDAADLQLGSWPGSTQAGLSVELACVTPILTFTRTIGSARIEFRQPRNTVQVGETYVALQWMQQPSAPIGVEGQVLTMTGVLTGGRSYAPSASQVRAPTVRDSATIDWERSDDNGLSWRVVGRSWEYEANPSPFSNSVQAIPWDYWSTGYGLPAVTRADANALFRGRACYQLPNATVPGCVVSEPFRLTLAPQGGVPTITSISPSQLVRDGQTASFTVAAAGLPAPTLQWQQLAPNAASYVDLPGATGTTYTTAPTTLAQTGTRYRVVATNGFGRATSAEVTLSVSTIDVAPTILTQPAPLAVVAGSEAVFAVDARGTEALSYAWRKDGVPIPGANSAVLRLAAVNAGSAGTYSVVVSNGAGSVTSGGAVLAITPGAPGTVAPSIVTQPSNATVASGNTATFGVGVAGTGPFTYQWRRNGTAITGATAAVYSVATAADADAGDYTVVVTNSAGTATSSAAALTVTPAAPAAAAPTIATPPASLAVFPGTTATLAVAASGSGPLAYQWSRNGTALPGATSAVLTLANVTGSEAGSYTVAVSNAAGSVSSSAAALIVIGAPVIVTQPASTAVTEGQAATFTLGATGDGLRYQWTRNGVAIGGATGVSHTTPALALGDSGATYAVVVYNGAGIVFSQAAVVTVTAPPPPPAAAKAAKLGAGWRHTCGVRTDDSVACWGYNSSGQIGSGSFVDQRSPVSWALPGTVVSVAAGERGSCAVLSSGRVFCSGAAVPGGSFNAPVEIADLGTVRQVVIGSSHACALASAGTVKCWGNNSTGQLGDGTNIARSTPVDVLNTVGALLTGAVELEAGDSFTCARFASGGVVCWGDSAGVIAGQPVTSWRLAQDFPGLSGVTSLAAGELHLCARRNDGTVLCAGSNGNGQLGNGSTSFTLTTTPTAVPNLANVAAISGGTQHLCALMNDGTVQCWGRGLMGNGGLSETRTTPVAVRNLAGVVQLAAGFEHTCALLGNGQLTCWGAGGEGQLGQGDTLPRTVPTAVPGGNVWALP